MPHIELAALWRTTDDKRAHDEGTLEQPTPVDRPPYSVRLTTNECMTEDRGVTNNVLPLKIQVDCSAIKFEQINSSEVRFCTVNCSNRSDIHV